MLMSPVRGSDPGLSRLIDTTQHVFIPLVHKLANEGSFIAPNKLTQSVCESLLIVCMIS